MSTLAYVGALHRVNCERCRLKMACNCYDGNSPDRVGHIIVLCPRCQVADLADMILGEKTLREILLSKIEQSKEKPSDAVQTLRPRLRLVLGNGETETGPVSRRHPGDESATHGTPISP